MSTSAVIMMVITTGVVWGGLVVALLHLRRQDQL
jgi:hypothetical protein